MKKFIKSMALCIVLSLTLSSCYMTRVTVGNGPVGKEPNTQVYSTNLQMYLFGGLIPLNTTNPARPSDGNYQVRSSTSFWDYLVGSITFGIFDIRHVRIIVKSK